MNNPQQSRRKALELVDEELGRLIQEGHGERVITIKAADNRITFVETTATRKHKLT